MRPVDWGRGEFEGRWPAAWLIATTLACADPAPAPQPDAAPPQKAIADPAPPAQPEYLTIKSFTASPSTVAAGESALLSWRVTGAESVRVDAPTSSGNLAAPTSAAVGQVRTPPLREATVFALIATKGERQVSATVRVDIAAAQLRITRFDATPATVPLGQTATLSWAAQGAQSIRIEGPRGKTVASSTLAAGSTVVTIDDRAGATFRLIARAEARTAEASTNVSAKCAAPIVKSLRVRPRRQRPGKTFEVQWNVEGADKVLIEAQLGVEDSTVLHWPLPASGKLSFALPSVLTQEPTLAFEVADGDCGGLPRKFVPLNVIGKPPRVRAWVTSDDLYADEDVELFYAIKGAATAELRKPDGERIELELGKGKVEDSPEMERGFDYLYVVEATNLFGTTTATVPVHRR